MEWIADPTAWLGLLTLIVLELVLGIDNLVFIAILADKLPPEQRDRARVIGLTLALVMRLGLLASISWMVTLTEPLFEVFEKSFSGRDLIMLFGGLFLLFKSTSEIYHGLEGEEEAAQSGGKAYGFMGIIVQIAIIDIVFSLDSVITAVGLVDNVPVMVAAIIISVIVMMLSAGTISDFIDKHPSLKMLALSFLIVVGTVLIAEAFDVHVPKGYVYFAMAFSLAVEAVNIRMRGARTRKLGQEPVQLRKDLPD